METTKKNYALPIAIMFALFFMIAFVTGLQNPFGVIVKNQFGASDFLSQLGNLANFIAYACMGIPAGYMLSKIGYKKTALLAVVIGFAGVAVTFVSGKAESFGIYLCGAFVSGFSMCMLNTLGGGGNKGNQLIQLGGVCNSSAATIVPVLVGYLMGTNEAARTIAKANPALFIAMGIFALAFIVLAVSNIPEPAYESAAKEEKPAAGGKKYSAMSFRHFVLGIVAIFIYVGVEVGIPNISNLYMTQELGIDPAMAGSLVGTYWFLMLVGRLVGGSIAGKVSSKTMLSCVSVIGLCLVLAAIFTSPETKVMMPVFQSDISFGMLSVPANIMFLVLCGLCTSVMWGGIFNLAVEGLGKFTAAASGIFMVMVCGGGILPAIQGFVADATSYMTSYWVIVAGLGYLLFYALVGSKNVNKDIPVE